MPRHVTPSVAKELLTRYDLRAGVRHGQHFLVDPNTVRRIVRLADVRPDEAILEIGPGLGSLTVALAEAARRVIALEIDTTVARALDDVLEGAPNVEVVVGDAMQLDIAAATGEPVRLVANLPYNVATPLFVRILSRFPSVTGGLVMVQRELGQRWTAGPGSRAYAAVSVRTRFHATAEIVGDVPKTVFMPPPKVESVLVAFTRRDRPEVDVADVDAFFAFVQKAFAHRRKTLRNSLVASGFERERVEAALDRCGVGPTARPEDVDLATYADLERAL